jgi:hypothetical protein
MSSSRRLVICLNVAALAGGCREEEPLDPNIGRLRPAQVPAAKVTHALEYELSPESRITFGFRSREPSPTGWVEKVRGRLTVDPAHLAGTRGVVEADLSTVRTTLPGTGQSSDPEGTRTTLEWLDLGAQRPVEDREAVRWATLELREIVDLSSPSAHSGTLHKEAAETRPAAEGLDGSLPAPERRRVTFTARADLTLHARRAETSWPIQTTFEYPAPATSGIAPNRIVVETRAPVPLELPIFDIVPRDAMGTVLSSESAGAQKRLGSRVWATVRLVLVPAAGKANTAWRPSGGH